MTTPSNGARTLVFFERFLRHAHPAPTSRRNDRQPSATSYARDRHVRRGGFATVSAAVVCVCPLSAMTLTLHLPDVLGVSGGGLGDLCLGLGDCGFSRHQLRVQVGVLDAAR